MAEETLTGLVLGVDARGAWVDAGGERLFCRLRGRLYEDPGSERHPVAPGDRVEVSRTAPGEGVVEERHPRRSRLSRRAGRHGETEQVLAANVDQVAIVVAVRNPRLRPGLIDRIIVGATNCGVEPFVVVNKIDLGRSRIVDQVREIYQGLGYPVLTTSAIEGEGLEALRDRLAGKVSVLTGHSGVGKSTLLNRLDPALGLKVGEVSRQSGKGRHTTTRAELLPVPGGGWVVDTPGIRAFGLWDLEAADLDIFFEEFQPLIERCRFYDCTHSHEPGCAVRAAVEEGRVDERRHAAYLRILQTLSDGGEGTAER